MTPERLADIERRAGHVASPEGAALMRELVAEVRRLRGSPVTLPLFQNGEQVGTYTPDQYSLEERAALVAEVERLRDRLTEGDY